MHSTSNSSSRSASSPVRTARLNAGLTREQLAVKACVSTTTVYLAERALLSQTTAKKLAAVLGCEPATLLP